MQKTKKNVAKVSFTVTEKFLKMYFKIRFFEAPRCSYFRWFLLLQSSCCVFRGQTCLDFVPLKTTSMCRSCFSQLIESHNWRPIFSGRLVAKRLNVERKHVVVLCTPGRKRGMSIRMSLGVPLNSRFSLSVFDLWTTLRLLWDK